MQMRFQKDANAFLKRQSKKLLIRTLDLDV